MRISAATTSGPASIYRLLVVHERQILTVRQHPAILIGPAALALAGLVAAPFVASALPARLPDLGLVVWAVWFVLVVRLAWRIAGWTVAFLVVTSERILLVTGFFARTVSVIPLQIVNDVTLQRTLGGQLFGFGDFLITSGAPDQVLQKIEYIPYPEELYQEICNVVFPPEKVICPLCRGVTRVFQRPQDPDQDSGSGENYQVSSPEQSRDSLLADGYLEIICPECGGEGTVAG
jgi:Bacterial PH domain